MSLWDGTTYISRFLASRIADLVSPYRLHYEKDLARSVLQLNIKDCHEVLCEWAESSVETMNTFLATQKRSDFAWNGDS